MTPAGQMIGIVLVIAGLIGIGVIGGRASRRIEIDAKQIEINLLEGKLLAETVRANGNATALTSLKTTLQDERERRARMQRATAEELAGLADRVAALTLAAERFEQDIRKKASNDEECTALRSLPVCGAVADGLWGRAAAAGTHRAD